MTTENVVQLAISLHECIDATRRSAVDQLGEPARLLHETSAALQPILSARSPWSETRRDLLSLYRRTDTLLALANDHINCVDFHLVQKRWLNLYTDASLLLAIVELALASEESDDAEARARSAVRNVDMAIVIAGAVGEGRMELAQLAIHQAQALIPARDNGVHFGRPTSDRRNLHETLAASIDRPQFAPRAIPVLQNPPSVNDYLRRHVNHPFVLRGFLTSGEDCPSWPAITRWVDPYDLLLRVGLGRHVPVEVGLAYDEEGWTQKIVDFQHFLELSGFFGHDARASRSHGEQSPHYLAQHSLFRQFPELENDFVLPDYVWSAPPSPSGCPSYHPPDTDTGVIVNAWVGGGDGQAVSPAHTDPYYNCYAQVLGQKRVWLAPPESGPYMAAHGTQHDETTDGNAGSLANTYMGNTSSLPILRLGSSGQAICEQNMAFANHVWPRALESVLFPGDMLVMPAGWWHAMRGEGKGPAWSVSMWY